MVVMLYCLVGALLFPHGALAAWSAPTPMLTSGYGLKEDAYASPVVVKPPTINPIAALFGGSAVTIDVAAPPDATAQTVVAAAPTPKDKPKMIKIIFKATGEEDNAVTTYETAQAVEAQTVVAAAPTTKDKPKKIKIIIKATGEEVTAVAASPSMVPAVDPLAAWFDNLIRLPVSKIDSVPPTVAPPVLVPTNPDQKGKKATAVVTSPVLIPAVDPLAALFNDPGFPVYTIDTVPPKVAPPFSLDSNLEEKAPNVVPYPFMEMVVGSNIPTFIIKDPPLDAAAAEKARAAAVDASSPLGLIGMPMQNVPTQEAWWLQNKYLPEKDWQGGWEGDSKKGDEIVKALIAQIQSGALVVPGVALYDEPLATVATPAISAVAASVPSVGLFDGPMNKMSRKEDRWLWEK